MTRPGPAFSNSTCWEVWAASWCDRCVVEAPYRNGISAGGCPLILTAVCGDIPDEWLEGEKSQDYTCVNFKRPGGRGPEPRPQPEPPDMDGLFERPIRRVRMFAQPNLAGVPV